MFVKTIPSTNNSIQLRSNLDIVASYTTTNYGANSRLFRKLQFGMEALFNPPTISAKFF